MSNLSAWLSPEHLTESAKSRLRNAFHDSPLGLVVVDNFLPALVADALADFLGSKALFETRFGTYTTGLTSEAEWMLRPEADRMFHFQGLLQPIPGFEVHPNTLMFLRLRHAVRNGELSGWFSEVTGLSFTGSTNPHGHKYLDHDFLKEHTDDALNRKLAVIVYLSRKFGAISGGTLSLKALDQPTVTVVPQFNRAAFFDVSKNEHFVAPVQLEAGGSPRLSIGWWLLHE